MKPLDSVAFRIVHWSGSGSYVKGRHCDLEGVCYESVIRVNYRWCPMVRKVVPDMMLDHRLGLLVLDGPGCKPSSVNVDDGEERRVSLLGKL